MARVVLFSGAGISAESGISTFRESGGLWDRYDVNVVCNYDSMQKNEAITIEFYDKRRADLEDKEPNYAHDVIADLKEKYPDDIAVITQNVDNLFEKAGLKHEDVIHLHGFMTEVRCQNQQCNKIFDIGYKSLYDAHNGFCPRCGTGFRPNIVFFGEAVPMYEELNRQIQDCELFVVIGTSGNVVGVNTIAQYVQRSILNNYEPSPAIEDALFSKVLYKKATDAIEEIAEEIEAVLESR
ncbi:MAG: NAD-dependent deacetylase [Sulfurimonas sp.]|uniref:SIR2 family NAD-dependent protein deacylase n=1 Tax=Sulfurimonas sp. TaxID=2022749 RepID=UPI0026279AE3|nr:Sir2 family NAD-dependent protein deacetylase [Sulfurimonas sp.]MCW8895701.1 NAD-dependent deacetylase [Sulfurimonas sp.]MCW8953699.1 NAD-dependent deacetylase [Sulfurimonas sp.]MCW9068251.1 NAD-dependent deacetylase [Sulfurimonas sp.]